MSKSCGGVSWWQSLHPWHKMAVVSNYPELSCLELARELGLTTKGRIVGVRDRLKKRLKSGKSIPYPCKKEEVEESVISPDSPQPRSLAYQTAHTRKRKVHKVTPLAAAQMSTYTCVQKNCINKAVPKIAFCAECARLIYKPLPKYIEALIANNS